MTHLSAGLLLTGATLGLGYGVLAVGLVLVYRAHRVVNVAHGQVGALGAAVLADLVVTEHVPWVVALPVALAVGAATGAVVELLVVRRLERAPRVLVLVATLGVAQVLSATEASLPRPHRSLAFPSPLHRSLGHGATLVPGPALVVLALVPAVVAGLALLLARTPTGRAIRAMADNRDAAALAGIRIRRTGSLVWATSGALAALSVVLLDPLLGVTPAQPAPGLGPGLLLRALAAALAGGLESLPLALAGGVVVGVLEAPLYDAFGSGAVDLALLGVVLGLVLLRGRDRDDEQDVALPAGTLTPVPQALTRTWWAPRLPVLGWAGVAVVLALVPAVTSRGALLLPTRMLLLAVLGLSLVVLTGWAGQVSLGQAALFGLGAWTTYALVQRHVPFWAAVVEGTVAGTLAALLLGLPALRVRGLFLAVTTLAFAVAAQSWLFQQPLLVGDRDTTFFLRRPDPVRSERAYYWLCLLVLLGAVAVVAALRRSGPGRAAVAVRANERRAASLGIAPVATKLAAFAVAGALAAFAGGLYAGARLALGPFDFTVFDSLAAVALVVIGGAGTPLGALLGALYLEGIPQLFPDDPLAARGLVGAGLLVLLLYFPGGLAAVVARGRTALLDRLAAGRPAEAPAAPTEPRPDPVTVVAPRPRPGVAGSAPVDARDISVSFGGRLALDGVDLSVAEGEVLGLIGANGAGKSTLLAVLSGFQRPATGRVLLRGLDVTRLGAAERARLGVGRVFQDARLFGDLSVRETLLLALEAGDPTDLVPAALALPPARAAERRKRSRADDVIGLLGLAAYADRPVRALSTGTRRVVEIGCLVAQGARTLLLDEPTAGLAQRETEAFGPLLLQLRADLAATVVLVEHDLPLVSAVCDRVQCLGAGRTLAVGTPDEVTRHPDVVASYLGTDARAVQRSGEAGPPVTPRRRRAPAAAG